MNGIGIITYCCPRAWATSPVWWNAASC